MINGEDIKIIDNEHFLYISKQEKNEYFKYFIEMINFLEKKISNSQFKNLLENNLQILKPFIMKQYLQYAVETTVNYYFARNFDNFIYEKKSEISGNDVDCQIKYKNYEYNIEVKCPEITEKEKGNSYFQIGHRTNNYDEMIEKGKEFMSLTKEKMKFILPTEVGGAQSKDLKLYDFLCDAHKKSGINRSNKINVLVVSLYNRHYFNEWYNYLFLERGLFRNDSFKNYKDYENIDIVVFNSSINNHANYNKCKYNPWNLEEHFNFIVINPLSKLKKEEGIELFKKEILKNNYLDKFNVFNFENEKVFLENNDKEIFKEIFKHITEENKIPFVFTKEWIEKRYYKDIKHMYELLKEEEKKSGYYFTQNKFEDVFFPIVKFINYIEDKENISFFQEESKYMYQKMR